MKIKFTKEEQKVILSWSEKQKARDKVYDSDLSFQEKLNALLAIDGERCEHDRDLMGTCGACDALHEKLRCIITGEIPEDV